MTESEIIQRMKGYAFYHTIQLTENVWTDGWEVVRPTTELTLRLLRTLDLQGKRVLDIGCRDGLFCFEAERLGAAEVIGIDNDPSIPAREFLIPCLRSKARLEELNLYDLRPETFGQFDVVIFPGVLYHLRYPFWALKLVRDVLAESGTLVLETAVYADNNRLPLLLCPVGQESPYEPTSCTFYNIKALKDTLHSLGLTVRRVETLHHSYPVVKEAPFCSDQAAPVPLDRAALIADLTPEILDGQTTAYWESTHRMHSQCQRGANVPTGKPPAVGPGAATGLAQQPLDVLLNRLRPYEAGLPCPAAVALLGDSAQEAAAQVWKGRHPGLDYRLLERIWPSGRPLEEFLQEIHVGLLYLNEPMLRYLELSRSKEAWGFLNGSWPPGWQCANGGNEPGDRWRLFVRIAP
ncbi:MAG: DUF1698 domain-containing protein [Planctomycetes bacterium]|nr:DUF1698 domain-containing protein [Planctomycetota bacterium]